MKNVNYYFCLIDAESAKLGTNLGRKYVYDHESEWVLADSNISTYLTTGYVKGVDYCVTDNKAYSLLKTFIDLEKKCVIILCKESSFGCDK